MDTSNLSAGAGGGGDIPASTMYANEPVSGARCGLMAAVWSRTPCRELAPKNSPGQSTPSLHHIKQTFDYLP